MHVFISYSREDAQVAEKLNAALSAAGFQTFYGRRDLPIGEEFNRKIAQAISACDLLVFLASDCSIKPGSYARAELAFAESKWPNPNGFVLPVLINGCLAVNLPAHLRTIGALSPDNLDAQVVAWVESRLENGTSRPRDLLSQTDRLRRWAGNAQPPIKSVESKIPTSFLSYIFAALFLVIFGIANFQFDAKWNADNPPGSFLGPMPWYTNWSPVCWIGAVVMLIYALAKLKEGLSTPKAVAVVILNRPEKQANLVDLETSVGRRLSLEPVGATANKAYPSELGWAYISGTLLLDFTPASAVSLEEPSSTKPFPQRRKKRLWTSFIWAIFSTVVLAGAGSFYFEDFPDRVKALLWTFALVPADTICRTLGLFGSQGILFAVMVALCYLYSLILVFLARLVIWWGVK